jgi:predicted permease
VTASELPLNPLTIFVTIICPLAILSAMGYIAARRFDLNVPTLSKLSMDFFIPAILFSSLARSHISGPTLAVGAVFTVANTAIMSLIGFGLAGTFRVDRSLRNAMVISLAFYNSANFGIPVMQMGFGNDGVAIQTAVVSMQAILTYSWGIFLAAGGRFRKRDALLETVKQPVLYALVLGLVVRYTHPNIPAPVNTAINHLAAAMVPVALMTLGAQIARARPDKRKGILTATVVFRLIGGPLVGLGLIYLLRLHGITAQALLVGSASPTAVNTTILAIEYRNQEDFAVNTVFIATLFSGLTVATVIYLAKILFPV